MHAVCFTDRLARNRTFDSQAYFVGGIIYGLLFLFLLGKYLFSDLSDSENIVITPVGIHLGEGFGSIKINWNELGDFTREPILQVILAQAAVK